MTNRRQYFTESELGKLINATRKGRYGHRDATLILIMARHGLRVSEAVDLEWSQIDFTRAHLHVRRLKGGIASVHPIQGDELRALRELRRQTQGAFVFESERGGPMTRFNCRRWWSWRVNERGWRTRTRTCCATLAGTYWPTLATTPDDCSCGWATSISSTRRTTAN